MVTVSHIWFKHALNWTFSNSSYIQQLEFLQAFSFCASLSHICWLSLDSTHVSKLFKSFNSQKWSLLVCSYFSKRLLGPKKAWDVLSTLLLQNRIWFIYQKHQQYQLFFISDKYSMAQIRFLPNSQFNLTGRGFWHHLSGTHGGSGAKDVRLQKHHLPMMISKLTSELLWRNVEESTVSVIVRPLLNLFFHRH